MATPHERLGLSRGQVDRAGGVLRRWAATGMPTGPEVLAASTTLAAFRDEFRVPLRLVVMGLRSAVRTEGVEVIVGERLKRQARIVEKLTRLQPMELSRMQDIAGCRAILPDQDAAYRVLARIRHHRSRVLRVVDYVTDPKPSGYRAIHVIVERNGAPVEIQLRTVSQQQWAMHVEDLDTVHGVQLKSDDGPAAALAYLRVYAEGLAEQDATGILTVATARRVAAARAVAMRELRRGGARWR